MGYSLQYVQNRYISLRLLRLNPTKEGFPWDDLCIMFRKCQRMAKVRNGVEISPKISTGWVGRKNVTDDRRTGDTYSEREREFTFTKTGHVTLSASIIGWSVSPRLSLHIFYLCAKFEHSSISRSRDMVRVHQICMVHVTWPRSFQGRYVIRGLVLDMVNLPDKFQVSSSIHYEDMKGDTKCRNWGGLE